MKTREEATVSAVTWSDGDHPGFSIVQFELGASSQGMVLGVGKERIQAFWEEMFVLFGLASDAPLDRNAIDALIGRECHVLRSTAALNEPIVGLEVQGRRWTLGGFCLRHRIPFTSEREHRRRVLHDDLVHATRRAGEAQQKLETMDDWFTEWDDTFGTHFAPNTLEL